MKITLRILSMMGEPNPDSDFDHELYDDDGQPLIDGDSAPLIPWQDGIEYTEGQFSYLSAFASAYREARKALQHKRTGRDYKVVGFKSCKTGFRRKKPHGSFKKFSVTKKPYTRNKKPKAINKSVKTAFKQYINGGSGHKSTKNFPKHVKCYRWGILRHTST